MDQIIPSIALDDFLASLRDRTANGVMYVALDDGELPVSVSLRPSSMLVFTFNGATDRSTSTLPRFAGSGYQRYVPASVIGLSDPTLERHAELTLGWYAGDEKFALQKLLPDFLHKAADALGVTRIVFVGGSGGGYAALYYSWHLPGSVALVTNAQTNLDRYRQWHLARYRRLCWPGLDDQAPLSDVIETDLRPLYSKRFDNMVIYLQIASDYFHLTRHFAPFVAALPDEHADHLIVRMENWGRQGHQPAPPNIFIPWLLAALTAPESTAHSIDATWNEMNQIELPALPPMTHAATRDGRIAADLAQAAARIFLDDDTQTPVRS
jgi:pimeloyl-ACP methyl ester carboxylesterase